jgi:cytochrome c peroxidase
MKSRTISVLAAPGVSAVLFGGLLFASLGPAPRHSASEREREGNRAQAIDDELAQLIETLGLEPLEPSLAPPPALLALGEALFFEPLLSGNRNIACATCHQPDRGTGDGLALAVGEGGPERGKLLARNSPPLYNVGATGYDRMFRDGRVSYDPATGVYTTPEPALNGHDPARSDITRVLDGAASAQALFPLVEHDEMRGQPGTNDLADAPDRIEVWRRIMARLQASARYRALLAAAYPADAAQQALNIGHVGRALAAYMRHAFAATDTPYDRYLRGDANALDGEARRGMALFFGKARCARCHTGPHLTDQDFHAVAVPQIGPGNTPAGDDLGVFPAVQSDAKRLYHFKTPPLRNVGATAPYMHDGVFATLREVIEHYRDPRRSIEEHCYAKPTKPRSGRPEPVEPAIGHAVDHAIGHTIDRDRFRNQLRLSLLPPSLAHPLDLDGAEVDALVAFLERGLTTPAALAASRAMESGDPARNSR